MQRKPPIGYHRISTDGVYSTKMADAGPISFLAALSLMTSFISCNLLGYTKCKPVARFLRCLGLLP